MRNFEYGKKNVIRCNNFTKWRIVRLRRKNQIQSISPFVASFPVCVSRIPEPKPVARWKTKTKIHSLPSLFSEIGHRRDPT